MKASVILIDDDAEILEAYTQTLELAGFEVRPCCSLAEATPHIVRDTPSVILTDVRMPDADGFAVLRKTQSIDREIPVLVISGHSDVPMALQAMREGAYDFIEKPANPAYVIELLRRASNHRELTLAHRHLKSAVQSKAIETRLVGTSSAIVELRDLVLSLAQVETTVLVHGETGTGKELVARCLHDFGARAKGPFVAINCAALPQTIIESELFGHEAGSFTGAKERRIGKIEQAQNGTLLLDEIESMPHEAQLRLLRVLQERRLERVGGNREIAIDVRIIAATKADLVALARTGQFREDLVYRLNVIPLIIPPLRERGHDIAILFRRFFEESASKLGSRAAPFPYGVDIESHDWPGNVRELRNAAERAALGFPPIPGLAAASAKPTQNGTVTPLAESMARHERRELERALSHGHTLSETARYLGISRKTLYLKMREHGLSAASDAEDADGS